MKHSVRRLLSIAVAAAGLGLVLGTGGVQGSGDHEQARRLKEAGEILPLESIIEKARVAHPGRVIEAELERRRGNYVYDVELVDRDGVVWELRFDAGTGELLETERED